MSGWVCRAASAHLPSPETTIGGSFGVEGGGVLRGWRSLITDSGEMTSLR